jgi:hypothetical protein
MGNFCQDEARHKSPDSDQMVERFLWKNDRQPATGHQRFLLRTANRVQIPNLTCIATANGPKGRLCKKLGFIVAQSLDPQDYANPSFPSTCLQFYLALTHVETSLRDERISNVCSVNEVKDNGQPGLVGSYKQSLGVLLQERDHVAQLSD